MTELVRAYRRIFQQSTRWRMMGYTDPRGTERLRQAVARMLQHDRGLNASAGKICITRGSQMALYLTAQVLVEKGDRIAVEDPGYAPGWSTFTQLGARLVPVPVNAGGLCVDALEKACRKGKLKAVYVTPHHQFPTTVTMKADRRLRLIELSNRYGFAIIEDDYDHEFHFTAKSLLPLASYEGAVNAIYIGSLSKLVAPALRTGYVMAAPAVVDALAAVRKTIDVQGDNVMEHAVAELMEEGFIGRHARKAYAVYRDRRDHMETLLNQHLRDGAFFTKPEGGLAYWLQFQQPRDTRLLAQALLQKGVSVMPTEPFSFSGQPLNALRLGFASLTAEELERGIALLGTSL